MPLNVPSDARVSTEPDDTTLKAVQGALARHQNSPGNLLPVLHAIQDALGHIPPACVPVLSKALNRSRAEIHGVISFYAYFRQAPAAPVKLEICRAEACQAMGGEALAQHAVQTLGCHFKGTSQNRQVDLEPVYCLGLCAQSPAVAVNGRPYARMTFDRLDQLLADSIPSSEVTP